VETELRRRAEARGLDVGSALPEGVTSWVACLLKRDLRDVQIRQAPLAVDFGHSIFVDKGGQLLTYGSDYRGTPPILGYAVDPAVSLHVRRDIALPTPVLSMQDRRIVSVATSNTHCLALSADGEVYSWGSHGSLGHGDNTAKAVPTNIDLLSRIEHIAAGSNTTSSAVDEKGRLFTWGLGRETVTNYGEEEDEDGAPTEFEEPNGLGYELDAETEYQ